MSKREIKELGCPGHFIMADRCQFRRHTQVGDEYRVSTVGNLYVGRKRETLGIGDDDWFETMVFKTFAEQDPNNDGCGCHQIVDYCEIDGRRYATAGEANAGHDELVDKYRWKKPWPAAA